ncbi:hypothetical protein VTH06DRAFT_4517, partial [Thermothelomyces fergusii]
MIELSANWEKLQAKIKAESASQPTTTKAAAATTKRKADESVPEQAGREGPKKKKRKQAAAAAAAAAAARESSSSKSQSQSQSQSRSPSKDNQGPPSMGNAVSSQIDPVDPRHGIAPSLAVWAADNDISAESIAEAYGLGLKASSLLAAGGPGRPNEGLAADVRVGKYVALDCEMVGVGDGGHEDALARVSVVDFHGRRVYDSYVRPRRRVVDWRTSVSGVAPRHMAGARPFDEVRAQIADLLRGRILVGHDVRHDLRVLELDHPAKMIRDTARFSGFKKYGNGPKPALRVLARELLGVEIQTGKHSSLEDARVAMLLFRKHKPAFDMEHANRYPDGAKPRQQKKASKGKKQRN